MSLLQAIQQEPWAITAGWLPLIEAIAERGHAEPAALEPLLRQMAEQNGLNPEAVLARAAEPMKNAHRLTVREGVALLPVRGPLFRYANLMTELSGATSYQAVAADLERALADPAVGAVIPWIDSPGGQVNGVNETAEMIFKARGRKPIRAYVGGTGASGGYWLASAADDITVDETAVLGSIGVRVSMTDTRPAEEARGYKRYEIVSDLSPDKKIDPAIDADRARVLDLVNQTAAVFVDKVARNRGVSRETVLARYGRGGLLVGRAAVDAGLADRTGSLEGLIAEINATGDPTASFNPPGAAGHSTGASAMAAEQQSKTAPAAGTNQPGTGGQAAAADTSQEALAQARAEGLQAGVQQERERIAAILDLDAAATRPGLARTLALQSDMPAEAAGKVLAAAAEEKPAQPQGATAFERQMEALGNPDVDPDGDGGQDEGRQVDASWDGAFDTVGS